MDYRTRWAWLGGFSVYNNTLDLKSANYQFTMKNVGIIFFDDAEVLDFAGPFEVFSVTDELNQGELFRTFTVAKELAPVKSINGLSVNPNYSFANALPIDILLIAGGYGARAVLHDEETISWIYATHQKTDYTLSICSGSLILAKLGLLHGQPYCTHHQVYADMQQLVKAGRPLLNQRFVQAGKIFTSGGISAGIDLSFHLVSLLHGKQVAKKTAAYMEYDLKAECLADALTT
jgi:transcriptional regulator GlxA family with amidase domain